MLTDGNGNYVLIPTLVGTYTIEFDWSNHSDALIQGGAPSPANVGTDDSIDSDGVYFLPSVTRATGTITLTDIVGPATADAGTQTDQGSCRFARAL